MNPLKNDKIQYQLSKKLECKRATVLSRADNVTSKYKSFYNTLNKGDENQQQLILILLIPGKTAKKC